VMPALASRASPSVIVGKADSSGRLGPEADLPPDRLIAHVV